MSEMPLEVDAAVSEIDEVAPDIPLRQGDVILHNDPSGDIFKRAGVVVTADCHLAHRKHRGHLNFVPVLPSSTYLAVTWIDDQLQERRALAEQELHRLMSDAHSALLRRDSTLTVDRAAEWTREAGFDEIAQALSLVEGSSVWKRVAVLAELIRSLDQLPYADFDGACELLRTFCGANLGKNFTNTAGSLSKRLTQLPDDAFFLNGGGELTDHAGYVCYLRLMQRVDESEISTTNNPLLDRGQRPYRRVGHLCSPFIYAITQSLGHIYSTIGLPESYEEKRDEAAAVIRRQLEGEK